jgi:hypothetical protein
MVDFRYHLVSLVSVFLALAVGIILGAGPLQNAIGDTLSNRVEALRASRDDAREKFDAANDELKSSNAALKKAGEQLVDKTLTGRRVALVVMPGASDGEITAAQESLTLAGATITGRMDLNAKYASSDGAAHRKAVAGQVGPVLGQAQDAGPDDVIAAAISHILRKGVNDGASAPLVAALTAKGDALVKIADLKQPADAVLVVAPKELRLANASKAKKAAAAKVYTQAFKDLSAKGPTAALGADGGKNDLIVSLRGTKSGSTVDHAGGTQASINTPIAVASEILGGHVHLGTGQSAESPIGTRVDVAVPGAAGSNAANGNG